MLDGCNGSVCRACRPALSRMELRRKGNGGTENGWVCGFVCTDEYLRKRCELPGRQPGGRLKLIAAACSLGRIAVGDVVTVGEQGYIVDTVSDTVPTTAALRRWEDIEDAPET